MTSHSKMPLTFSLTLWNRKTRIILPCVNIKYKLAAGKTAKVDPYFLCFQTGSFDIKEVREITMYDELDLDMLGDERTALFLIM